MPSHASKYKAEETDWKAVLEKVKADGWSIAPSEHERLRPLARCWTTCAVGMLPDVIPRDHMGQPHDPALHQMGAAFSFEFGMMYFESALARLERIHARAEVLMKELNLPNDESQS